MQHKQTEVLKDEYRWIKPRREVTDEYHLSRKSLDMLMERGAVDWVVIGQRDHILGTTKSILMLEANRNKYTSISLPDPKPHGEYQQEVLRDCDLGHLIRT